MLWIQKAKAISQLVSFLFNHLLSCVFLLNKVGSVELISRSLWIRFTNCFRSGVRILSRFLPWNLAGLKAPRTLPLLQDISYGRLSQTSVLTRITALEGSCLKCLFLGPIPGSDLEMWIVNKCPRWFRTLGSRSWCKIYNFSVFLISLAQNKFPSHFKVALYNLSLSSFLFSLPLFLLELECKPREGGKCYLFCCLYP